MCIKRHVYILDCDNQKRCDYNKKRFFSHFLFSLFCSFFFFFFWDLFFNSDMPWQTEILYVYNSNKVLESVVTKGGTEYNKKNSRHETQSSSVTSGPSGSTGVTSDPSLGSEPTSPNSRRSGTTSRSGALYDGSSYDALKYDGSQCPFAQNSYQFIDESLQKEEVEILTQIRKFCFPDLSNIINSYFGNGDKHKSENRHFKARWKHALQSEKFTFVLTKSGGQRLFGHVRRLYSPLGME